MKGLYCYINSETSIPEYIGQSSDIGRRFREHLYPSKYDCQVINRVLQNNPDKYEAKIICEYPDLTDDELNWVECMEIMKHKFLYDEIPRFNFDVGGNGSSGYKHTGEAKVKISEAKSRNDLDDDVLAKEYFDNGLTTYEIAEKYNCHHMTVSRRLKKNGHKLRDYSEYHNTSGYFRVIKEKSKTVKQRFVWCYQYTENGKRKKIRSVDIEKLEEKVKAKGLEWRKL